MCVYKSGPHEKITLLVPDFGLLGDLRPSSGTTLRPVTVLHILLSCRSLDPTDGRVVGLGPGQQ